MKRYLESKNNLSTCNYTRINVSDVAIAVGVGIGAPCITIIAVLVYCHKNRHRLDRHFHIIYD